ncbi:MAG: aminoacyl-tRNA hydrolase [Chloroflexota bacterium]|nr:aminoacyl-tRNA hydrolase [Chloroflexota bacterium]
MISRFFGRPERPADGASWLVVGLGNPGREYERNRHNVGFRVLDAVAGRYGVRFGRRSKGKLAVARRRGEPLYLLEPQTYVNASGQSVGPIARFYRVPPERMLVICDDIDLPFGRIRIRPNGSSGGHNGLKSIIEALGKRQDFPRIRFGVGRPPHVREVVVSHVLEDFSKDEERELDRSIPDMLEAVELILDGNIERAMDSYNRRKVLSAED